MSTFNRTNCSVDVEYLTNQLIIARNEISNLRQQLKTLTHTHRKECDNVRLLLENWQCVECRNRQQCQQQREPTENNEVDLPAHYIGTISTHFPEKKGTPRQPGICSSTVAKLTLSNEVFTNPEHALEGLQEFSHMWILFHFHKNDSTHTRAKVAPPRLNGLRTGVLATRSPHRPCPIGLSLVKIDRIMENTIYFSGVDMVDQTPVLDIKPYIPQYDNPALSVRDVGVFHADVQEPRRNGESSSVSEVRLAASSENGLNFDSDMRDVNLDFDRLNVRIMDGEENGGRNQAVPGDSLQNAGPALEESFYSRSASRIGEREAPDGEEEESPRQPTGAVSTIPSTPDGLVRVPSWISQPPVSTLTVYFRERALSQLSQLGNEAEEKKTVIRNVLREDPRSVYLRERWGSHCYVFRIAELYVSCKFDDSTNTVTVFQVFQNSAQEPDE